MIAALANLSLLVGLVAACAAVTMILRRIESANQRKRRG